MTCCGCLPRTASEAPRRVAPGVPHHVQAANKELSAKLASQTQRLELLVSQSMLVAAAAAGAGQANPGAESPLVKALSSSQAEVEQVQQQLMLMRSPSRSSAVMASPGSGRLASETGQLEYLDEGDEVRKDAARLLAAMCPPFPARLCKARKAREAYIPHHHPPPLLL